MGGVKTGTMMSKIFHPNVSKAGEICVDTLKKGWKREYGVGHVLVVSSAYRNCGDGELMKR
jgi:ubiquitin-protein ligase